MSADQKKVFSISNVYWIGISIYEEHSELFAIKYQDIYVGLVGGGYDNDGISGFINPLMIDEKYQNKGYAITAVKLMIKYLNENLNVTKNNIGHRKENLAADKLYEKIGFRIIDETEVDYIRCLEL